MAEYDVKVTHLYGDTYRVEAYESARPAIFGLLAMGGLGLLVHLMDKYGLTFEQALWTITGAVSFALVGGAVCIAWLRRKFF